VYNIDLSFFKSSSSSDDEISKQEVKYNELYKDKIIDTISDNYPSISGCFTCGAECFSQTPFDLRSIVEAECSGLLGCHYCENKNELDLLPGDLVVVQNEDCIEIATVKLFGEIVRLKRQIYGLYEETIPCILRKATTEDFDKYVKNLEDELKAKSVFKKCVEKYALIMKLVNIHYQFDRRKLYFFYTSDGRVDFRELAKELAAEFKTRIELRQIGVRDEAKKVGGVGTCGREFCCSLFLNNFKRISTQNANEQNSSANLSKLSGPCSKLKCCLSFEL
jgi:cell fate regulator YaaT (PSP1 superfamily)